MIFETKINGIPCQCRVLGYSPFAPMIITGSGYGDAIESEQEEFDFEILDRKGYHSPWLERMVTDRDIERLLREYINYVSDLRIP